MRQDFRAFSEHPSVTNLYASPIFASDIKGFQGPGEKLMVVSPDVGGVARRAACQRDQLRRWPIDRQSARGNPARSRNDRDRMTGKTCLIWMTFAHPAARCARRRSADQNAQRSPSYITHGLLVRPGGSSVSRIL